MLQDNKCLQMKDKHPRTKNTLEFVLNTLTESHVEQSLGSVFFSQHYHTFPFV